MNACIECIEQGILAPATTELCSACAKIEEKPETITAWTQLRDKIDGEKAVILIEGFRPKYRKVTDLYGARADLDVIEVGLLEDIRADPFELRRRERVRVTAWTPTRVIIQDGDDYEARLCAIARNPPTQG
jgi:hypothetical protein